MIIANIYCYVNGINIKVRYKCFNILHKIEQWNEHSSNINARLWEFFQLAIDFAGCEAPFCVL